jgi:maltooligosyltrehalose synthase
VPPERWGETVVRLPEKIGNRPFRDIFTSGIVKAGSALSVADILKRFPASILMQTREPAKSA